MYATHTHIWMEPLALCRRSACSFSPERSSFFRSKRKQRDLQTVFCDIKQVSIKRHTGGRAEPPRAWRSRLSVPNQHDLWPQRETLHLLLWDWASRLITDGPERVCVCECATLVIKSCGEFMLLIRETVCWTRLYEQNKPQQQHTTHPHPSHIVFIQI